MEISHRAGLTAYAVSSAVTAAVTTSHSLEPTLGGAIRPTRRAAEKQEGRPAHGLPASGDLVAVEATSSLARASYPCITDAPGARDVCPILPDRACKTVYRRVVGTIRRYVIGMLSLAMVGCVPRAPEAPVVGAAAGIAGTPCVAAATTYKAPATHGEDAHWRAEIMTKCCKQLPSGDWQCI